MTYKSRLEVYLGSGTFGLPGAPITRTTTTEEGNAYIDVLLRHGYSVVDSANLYGGGTSENLVGLLAPGNYRVDTKTWPFKDGDYSADGIRSSLQASIEKMQVGKEGRPRIRAFYLHKPDRSVPLAESHKAIDDLYKEGLFDEFGLSNYRSYEVAEFVMQADRYGWIKPTIYQGPYSAVQRSAEYELLPALEKYGIRFSAYSPLAGGFLSGSQLEAPADDLSHFSDKMPLNFYYRDRYWQFTPFLKKVKVVADLHGITLTATFLRWLQHHSKLSPEKGDAVVIGSRSAKQFEEALELSEQGPLPDDLVKVIEDEYQKAHVKYYHYELDVSV